MIVEDRSTEVNGVTVRVIVTRERAELNRQRYLRDAAVVEAEHGGCGELTAHIRAGSYFLALGRQDVSVGDPAFDDRYIVKTNAPDALAYWMGDGVAGAVLTTYEPTALYPFEVELTPRKVVLTARVEHQLDATAESPGPPAIPRLDEAVAAAAIIAGRGAALARAWRERLVPLGLRDAGAIWRTDDGYQATVEHGRTPVAIDFPWQMEPRRTEGLRTRLSIAWEYPEPATVARIEAARAAAGIEWLFVTGGRLSIGWERVVDDPARLRPAIALLARWAEETLPTDGPYR